MKTKHLLTGLVLPTLFAACTAEDIVSQQEVAKTDLSNRPVVGNVTLNFGEAESRATIGDRTFSTIEFVKGEDGFGARIIDSYSPATVTAGYTIDHASRNYAVEDDYASSNYKYVNAGGTSWSTDALMIEGNYMFYFPYSEKNLARTPNQVVLPVKQTVKPNEEDGYRNPIKDLYEGVNPAIVGYTFLSAADQDATVSPALHHLFAYPQITLTNNFETNVDGEWETQELTVTKVVLKSSNFKEVGTINHSGLVNALRDFKLNAVTYVNPGAAVALGTWNEDTRDGIYGATTTDLVNWNTVATNAKNIEVTFEGGLTLAPGESYSFHIVAPAAEYTDLTMTVYLSNDKMFDKNFGTMSFAPSKRYPTEEYNFPTNGTPSIKENLVGSLGTSVFERETLTNAVDPAEIIDNIDEFEAYLKTIKDNTTTITEIEDINTVSAANQFVLARTAGVSNLKIDAAVVELLNKYLKDGKVSFYSTMQVEDAENAVVLNDMTFNAGLEVLAGDVTAQGVTVAAGKTVTVKGGTLTIPEESSSTLRTVVVEGGELIANEEDFTSVNASKNAVAGTTGKVTVNYNTSVSNYKLNGGELVVAEDVTFEVGNTNKLVAGTVTVNGKLNILGTTGWTIPEDVTLDLYGEVTFASTGVLKNQGTINNYANLVVTNEGTVNMMSEEANLIAYGVGGNIYNSELAYVNVTTEDGGTRDDQTVWYVWDEDVNVATADAVDYFTYGINALEIQGKKFTLDAADDYWSGSKYNAKGLAYISTVKLTNGASVYAKQEQMVGMTKFIIEGAVTMSGWGMNNESSITLEKAATVEMALGSVLTVSGIELNPATAKALTFTAETPGAGETAAKVVNNGIINLGGAILDTDIVKDNNATGTWN